MDDKQLTMFKHKTQSVSLSSLPKERVDRFNSILIQVERHDRDEQIVIAPTVSICSIQQLIDRYTFTLGYNSVSLMGTVVTILTKGKIRVEFSAYFERLVLVNDKDKLGNSDAMELYSAYISSQSGEPEPMKFTQKLLVQLPKKRV